MRYFSKKIRLFCLTLALLMAFAPSALAASGFRLNAQEQAMIEMVNSDRARYGRSALTLDLELCALAREKSSDMLNNNYFAHESPTLGSASDLLTANGVSFRSVGENIALSLIHIFLSKVPSTSLTTSLIIQHPSSAKLRAICIKDNPA